MTFVFLMIMSEKYISELHAEHGQWLSELSLAGDEIKSFQGRLEEINHANTDGAIRAQVEHFQNQFIRQREVIDILRHDIHKSENVLKENVNGNETASDHRKAHEVDGLSDRMQTFAQIFAELKTEFLGFAGSAL